MSVGGHCRRVSKPLSCAVPWGILKAADLVRTERRGQHIVYSLNATVLQETAALLMDVFSPADKVANSGKSKRKPSTRHVK